MGPSRRRSAGPLRVLVAHSFYRVAGGEDRHVRQQVELLKPHHDVELLARFNDSLASNLSTAVRMAFSLEALRAVERRILMFGPDVIHLHNPYPALGAAVHLAAKRQGIPLVQTVHNLRLRCPNGLMFTEGRPCRRCEAGNYANALLHACFPSRSQASAYAATLWLHRFLMRLERMVNVFVAPSDFLSEQLRAWGIPQRRIRIIRNFVPSVPVASSTVGQYGTYVGRLSSEKGLGVLLEALSLAGDPPFQIIGDGPLQSNLIGQAARLGLKRTVFVGRLDAPEVSKVLSESRFLVMPSVCDENAPLAVLEALAAGRPVVLTRRGGLPELVRGGAGLICEPGDARSLAAKIEALLADDELCRKLGTQARGFAQGELSPERHRAQLEAVYLGAAEDGAE
jgi:glycosyltransferase involved in cell wall biosynthesis